MLPRRRARLPLPRPARRSARCRSTFRCCTATTTSWWLTSRTFWPPCRAVAMSRRRRSCGCGVDLEPARAQPSAPAGPADGAGVLLFTVQREVRGAYQTLFARGEGAKDVSGAGGRQSGGGVPADGCGAGSSRSAVVYRPSRSRANRTRRPSERRNGDGFTGLTATHRAHPPAVACTWPRWGCPYPTTIRCTRTWSMWQPTISPARCNCWCRRWNSRTRSEASLGGSPAAGDFVQDLKILSANPRGQSDLSVTNDAAPVLQRVCLGQRIFVEEPFDIELLDVARQIDPNVAG